MSFAGSIFSYLLSPQVYFWEKRKLKKETKSSKIKPGQIEVFEGSQNMATLKGIKELARRIDKPE